jgi:hypothetical protein
MPLRSNGNKVFLPFHHHFWSAFREPSLKPLIEHKEKIKKNRAKNPGKKMKKEILPKCGSILNCSLNNIRTRCGDFFTKPGGLELAIRQGNALTLLAFFYYLEAVKCYRTCD